MNLRLHQVCQQIQDKIDMLQADLFDLHDPKDRSKEVRNIIENETSPLLTEEKSRICSEFLGWGPLENLMCLQGLTEIIVNGSDNIWYEKNGRLFRHEDHFFSRLSYQNCIHRIMEKINRSVTTDQPFCDSHFFNFRISLVDSSVTGTECTINLRKQSDSNWNLENLLQLGWCDTSSYQFLKHLIQSKENFLILGATGSGKTAITSALLKETAVNSRNIVIEDTREIHLAQECDLRLLTSEAGIEKNLIVNQSELVKRALRLRPDRLVLGEIRGHEAKDFLMALSTGHAGSFGTIHADNPQQALLRLEMLVQMGSPQWSLQAIRRLINLSLQYLIHTRKNSSGERKLGGIYRIHSLEETGFILEKIDFSETTRLESHSFLQ